MKRTQSKKAGISAKQAESLIRRADPLSSNTVLPSLSPRATRELSMLYDKAGSVSAVVPPPRRRRVGLIAVAACGAAAVVAAVAVFAVNATTGDTDGGLVADEPVYESAQELEGAADLIVRAELGKGAERTVDDVTSVQAPAKVLATAKGTAPGPQVTVSYTPPDAGGPESAALTPGKEYVFLLERQDDGRFTLVNSTQGAYGVSGGRAVAGEGNAVTLSPGVLEALRLTG
ncbi:hypothetical protein ACIBKZ_19545 [Streptomyces sp. NPDC050421]|uniref:hypothetical protein n=1 Tax=unclassified Streptomyces TaxID=2593676 RepID=UPI0037B01E74